MLERSMATVAIVIAATPDFILWTPAPQSLFPSIFGSKGSHPHDSVRGSMSRWPLNIMLLPPPVPFSLAITCFLPGWTSCISVSKPRSSKKPCMNSAAGVSFSVKLGILINSEARSTISSSLRCCSTSALILATHL
jgi:hypothetical protein